MVELQGVIRLVTWLSAEASISTRSMGQDPTSFEAWSGPYIGGPDQVLARWWNQ